MENNPALPHDISGINTEQASFQFAGHFQNQDVLWHCSLQTLDSYYQTLLDTEKASSSDSVVLKRFIDIQNTPSATPLIKVVLDVDIIDEATIRKTIIMVHNYKNLSAGKHEYGTAYHYPRKD